MSEEEKYKLALFMVIRNSKVLPKGIEIGKTTDEIDKMSYETMLEVISMIDYEKAKKSFERGYELSGKIENSNLVEKGELR